MNEVTLKVSYMQH